MSTDESRGPSDRMGTADATAILDRVADGVFSIDTDWRFTYVNEQAEGFLGRPSTELQGETLWSAFPEALGRAFEEEYRQAMESQSQLSFEEYYSAKDAWFDVRAYPSETGLSVYFRDVTERVEREKRVRQFRALAETVSDVILAIDTESRIRYVNRAVEDVFGYAPDELVGESLTELAPDELADSHLEGMARYLQTGERTVDWKSVELPGRHREGHTVPVAISFSEFEHEGRQLFTGVIRDVSDRVERQRTLANHRDRLETLTELYGLVLSVARGLVDATSRDAIAETVCRGVTVVERYRSAWVGWVDLQERRVTAAAATDRSVDDQGFSYDSATGPAAEAVRTGSVTVGEAASTHPAVGRDGDTVIAVPLSYKDTVQGVLVIGTGDLSPVPDREREILTEVGSVVGHAITALERKAALTADRLRVVELEARGDTGPFDALLHAEVEVRVDRSVPRVDGGRLVYATVPPGRVDHLLETARETEAVEAARRVNDHADGVLVELTGGRVPVMETLSARGGNVTSFAVEDALRLTVEFPHTTDIREVYETVRAAHPAIEFVALSSRDREPTDSRLRSELVDVLTDRQQEALEAAHAAGYFEWGRETTGEEVAASLGCSPSTFHQHLRAAQRKLVDRFLS